MNLSSLFLNNSPKRLVFFGLLPLLVGFAIFLITAPNFSIETGYTILLFSAAFSQLTFVLYTTALSVWISGRSGFLVVATLLDLTLLFATIISMVSFHEYVELLYLTFLVAQLMWSAVITLRWLSSEGKKYNALDFLVTMFVTSITLVGAWNLHYRARLVTGGM